MCFHRAVCLATGFVKFSNCLLPQCRNEEKSRPGEKWEGNEAYKRTRIGEHWGWHGIDDYLINECEGARLRSTGPVHVTDSDNTIRLQSPCLLMISSSSFSQAMPFLCSHQRFFSISHVNLPAENHGQSLLRVCNAHTDSTNSPNTRNHFAGARWKSRQLTRIDCVNCRTRTLLVQLYGSDKCTIGGRFPLLTAPVSLARTQNGIFNNGERTYVLESTHLTIHCLAGIFFAANLSRALQTQCGKQLTRLSL